MTSALSFAEASHDRLSEPLPLQIRQPGRTSLEQLWIEGRFGVLGDDRINLARTTGSEARVVRDTRPTLAAGEAQFSLVSGACHPVGRGRTAAGGPLFLGSGRVTFPPCAQRLLPTARSYGGSPSWSSLGSRHRFGALTGPFSAHGISERWDVGWLGPCPLSGPRRPRPPTPGR
jgi:hypothetical protein